MILLNILYVSYLYICCPYANLYLAVKKIKKAEPQGGKNHR
ncbi:hypothetical protein JN11_01591 [Mucilaginibacter frigoritolerans]|uniref:Uncharacterized protein n=1 Tax=Mucilaginibacter frigoritolerans TaxID=652788 RepID=A0A562U6L1_9SPHI|nr:hypothetical protein JN11_01591 [Mucilaginibacter frigoritolerans]